MNATINGLGPAIASGFADCDREDLEAFANILGIEFRANIGDENLRSRLIEAVGEVPRHPEQTNSPVAPESKLSDKELFDLTLHPKTDWQGKRRLVSIARPSEYKGSQPQVFTWNGRQVTVPWNTVCSVPYPIYNIMKDARHIEMSYKSMDKEQGKAHYTRDIVNRFSMTDMGDDPATAHLPESVHDQFRQFAERVNYFRVEDPNNEDEVRSQRRLLSLVARRLEVRTPRDYSNEEMRDSILRYLGYDVDMMYFEEEEAA